MADDNFLYAGTADVFILPAVASVSAGPTRPEITAGLQIIEAGVDSDEFVISLSGFMTEAADVTLKPVESLVDVKIPGRKTTGDATIVFADNLTTHTIYDSFTEGDSVYVVIMPHGDVPGDRCSVFPWKVKDVNDADIEGEGAGQFTVKGSITGTPNKQAVIPAA